MPVGHNAEIAAIFTEIADLLEIEVAKPVIGFQKDQWLLN